MQIFKMLIKKLNKYTLVAGTSILLLLVGSMAVPFHAFALDVDPGIPPGLTRITIIHDSDGSRTEIDHGKGAKLPSRPQVATSCDDPSTDNTSQCDINTWRGWSWSTSPVKYNVNLDDQTGRTGEGVNCPYGYRVLLDDEMLAYVDLFRTHPRTVGLSR